MATSGAIRAGKAFVEIFAENNPLERGLKQAETKLKAFGAKVRGIGIGATTFGASVAAPFVAIGGAALKAAADFESAEVAFATMLGSAEAAKKVMADLAKFGAETPFELPELNDATKKLLAFGVAQEDLIPTLRAVGDISSGIGAPIGEIAELYGKAKVQGRLFMEDINQLTGRGIPIIQELAKQFGVTESEVRGLVSSGQVNFGNLERAFESLTGEGGQFAGMMDAQSKTLNGLFSTVLDTIGQVAREIGGVLIDDAKSFAAAVIDLGNKAVEWIQNNREMIATAVKFGVTIAAAGAAVATVGTALVGAGLVAQGVGIALGVMSTAVGLLISPLGLVVAGVAAAGYAFVQFTESGQALAATLGEAFGAIKDALGNGNIEAAADVLWSGLKLAWLEGTYEIRGTMEDLLEWVASAFGTTLDDIANRIATTSFQLEKWFGTSEMKDKRVTQARQDLAAARQAQEAFQLSGDKAKDDAELIRLADWVSAAEGWLKQVESEDPNAAIDSLISSAQKNADDGLTNDRRAAREKELLAARQAYDDAVAKARASDEALVETEAAAQQSAGKSGGVGGGIGDSGVAGLKRNAGGSLNIAAEVGTQAAADAIAKAINGGNDPMLKVARDGNKIGEKQLDKLDNIEQKLPKLAPGKTR